MKNLVYRFESLIDDFNKILISEKIRIEAHELHKQILISKKITNLQPHFSFSICDIENKDIMVVLPSDVNYLNLIDEQISKVKNESYLQIFELCNKFYGDKQDINLYKFLKHKKENDLGSLYLDGKRLLEELEDKRNDVAHLDSKIKIYKINEISSHKLCDLLLTEIYNKLKYYCEKFNIDFDVKTSFKFNVI